MNTPQSPLGEHTGSPPGTRWFFAVLVVLLLGLVGCPGEDPVDKPLPTELEAIYPATGPTSGGTLVTLRGDYLPQNAAVFFGGRKAERVQFISSSEIVAEAPLAEEIGKVGIIIQDLNFTGNTPQLAAAEFEYYDPSSAESPRPGVPEILSERGPNEGNTITLIEAQNVRPDAEVFFGFRKAEVLERGQGALVISTPENPEVGSVELTIQNGDGQFARAPEAFTYYKLDETATYPTLVQAEPRVGSTDGGTAVELTGANLPGAGDKTLVLFGTKRATNLVDGRENTLGAQSPAHETAGVSLTITTEEGLSSRLPQGFSFVAPEALTDGAQRLRVLVAVPEMGPPEGGSLVSVKGLGFVDGSRITLGSTIVETTYVDENTLTFTTPGGEGPQDVLVTNPDNENYNLKSGFTYREGPAPALNLYGVSPETSPLEGGETVELRGTGFVEGTTVSFGDRVAATVVVDSNTLSAVVPEADEAGPVDVTVTLPDERTSVLEDGFRYELPQMEEVKLLAAVPTVGNVAGGYEVELRGVGFEDGATVAFDDTEVEATVENGNTIVVVAPEVDEPDTVDITVTLADDRSSTLRDAFSFYVPEENPLQLLAVLPTSGLLEGGYEVELRGVGFELGATVTLDDGDPIGTQVLDENTLTFIAPALESPTTVDVTVTLPDERSSSLRNAFTYYQPEPAVVRLLAMNPTRGPTEGGYEAELRGFGFEEGATVEFGDTRVDAEFVNEYTLRVDVPASAEEDTVNVTVVLPDERASTLRNAFTYANPPVEDFLVLAALPAGGPVEGGTSVRISGVNFDETCEVTFGDRVIQPRFVDSNTLVITAPASETPGSVDVLVRRSDNRTASLTNAFRYFVGEDNNAPELLLLTAVPSQGSLDGGTTVQLRGIAFEEGSVVEFNGEEINTRFVDENTLEISTPAHTEAGLVDISVRNPDNTTSTLRGGFNYLADNDVPVVIQFLTPSHGPANAEIFTIVTGEGFDAQTEVYFDNVPSGEVDLLDSTTMIVQVPTRETFGAVDVAVTNRSGNTDTLPDGFSYVRAGDADAPPALSGVSPGRGPHTGGSRVAIRGLGFAPGAVVRFGRQYATDVTFIHETLLTAVTPAGMTGPTSVTVINPSGVAAGLNPGYLYDDLSDAPMPSITTLTPSSGLVQGGTPVVLDGDNLQDGSSVFVNGRPAAQVVFVSDERLTYQTPLSSVAGDVDVEVTLPNGLTAILEDGFNYRLPAPSVTNVIPARGPEIGGTIVRVEGEYFTEDTEISFGGRPAEVLDFVNATTLTVSTPAGPTGVVDVIVQNPDGQSDALEEGFTYGGILGETPELTSITPNQGPSTGGARVILRGSNFDAGMAVRFGASPSPNVTYISSELATAVVPAGAVGPTDVVVTSGSGATVTLADGYTYYSPEDAEFPAPTLTSLFPSRGSIYGGTRVSVAGDGFRSGILVFLGGRLTSDVTRSSGSLLTAVTPPAGEGRVSLEVTNVDGQSATLADAFEYLEGIGGNDSPEVVSVLPNRGPATGGTRVLMQGRNLRPGLQILIAGRSATSVELINAETVSFLAPAGSVGPATVTVINTDGRSDTVPEAFTYLDPNTLDDGPLLTGVLPTSGPAAGDTEVLLTGNRFDDSNLVFFGGRPAQIDAVLGQTLLRVRTPAAAPGVVDVEVVNGNGQTSTLSHAFTYTTNSDQPPPNITRVTPNRGTGSGGTIIGVVGGGFVRDTEIFIANRLAAVSYVADDYLEVTTPAGTPGAADVTAVNPDGQTFTLRDGFTYTISDSSDETPEVLGITPDSGAENGGEEVVISGRNFVPTPVVLIGGRPATSIRFVSDGLLRAVTPVGTPGTSDVVVTNPSGLSDRLVDGFNYIASPRILDAAPAVGPVTGGTTVSISGQNFQQGAAVLFGERPAVSVDVLGPSVISAVSPMHVAGVVDLTVINPDNQTDVLEGSFSFVPSPSVAQIRPAQGPSFGGSFIVIEGDSFRPGAQVFFGDEESTDVVFVDEQTLSVLLPAGTPGTVSVRVVNPAGQEDTAAEAFTYLSVEELGSAPELTSITPAQGPSTGGTWALGQGANFAPGTIIMVGRAPARSTSSYNEEHITFITPASVPSGYTGSVNVYAVGPDGQMSTLEDGFTYTNPDDLGDAPVLARVEPTSGSTNGGQTLSILGLNLRPGALVLVGNRDASNVRVPSLDLALVDTPPGNPGAADVIVTNIDGQSAVLEDAYLYIAPPTIDTITPNEGPATRATRITINGLRFVFGASVTVGAQNAVDVRVVDAGTIEASVPPTIGTTYGAQDVVVTNPDGQSFTYEDGFSYIRPPEVTEIDPTAGPAEGGETVEIYGVGFREGAVVQFGDTQSPEVTFNTDRHLRAVTPPGVVGLAGVTVTNPDGQAHTLAGAYTYIPAPRVDSVSPTSGSLDGGGRMVISGNFFQEGAQVFIGNNAAGDITHTSAQVLEVTIPEGVAGPAAITVTNPDTQRGVLAAGYTYIPPRPPPAITGISPNFGDEIGGTNVTILGNGFQFGATAFFGDNEAPLVEVINANYIRVRTPGHDPGSVDVTVVNPDGETTTVTAGFSYVARGQLPDLAVTDVVSDTGSANGNDRVLVVGAGFLFGAQITFDGVPCTDVVFVGPTILGCTTGAHDPGEVDVHVTNPNGDSATLDAGFTYGYDLKLDLLGWRLPPEALSQYGGVRLDADQDGDDDVFIYDDNFGQAYLYVNDGDGNFISNDLGRFESGCQYNSRCRATRATTGDIDNDQDIDILVGFSDRQMGLYRNNGDGTFSRHYICPNNNCNDGRWRNPGALGLLDVNADGALDLIVADNDGVNSVALSQGPEVFENNRGPWLFKEDGFPDTNEKSNAMDHGDVDGDGDIDLLIGNRDEEQNRLYLNDGTGRFVDATGTHFVVSGGNTTGAVLLDIDGDFDLDALIFNNGQQDRVMINDGDGRYTDQTFGRMPEEATSQTQGVYRADIDRDGDFDLITRRGDGDRVRVLLNLGTNTGIYDDRTDPRLSNVWIFGANGLVIGDWDRDGDSDVIAINDAHQNQIWINDSDGDFTDETYEYLPVQKTDSTSVDLGDIDGDGDLDMAISQYEGVDRLYINDGSGHFFDVTEERLPEQPIDRRAWDVQLADLNGDGDLDLFIGNYRNDDNRNGAPNYLYVNDGTGFFADRSSNLPTSNRETYQQALGDLDNDGDLDLVTANEYHWDSLRMYRNLGDGLNDDSAVLSDQTDKINRAAGPITALALVDLDGDGFLDIFTGISNGTNRLYLNNMPAEFSFRDVTGTHIPGISDNTRGVVYEDFDNDGDADLFIANWNQNNRLHLNQGDGTFSDRTATDVPDFARRSRDMAVGDFDQDGDFDFFVVNDDHHRNTVYLGVGADGYVGADDYVPWDNDRSRDVEVGDLDGDGDLDVIVVNNGQNRIYWNTHIR